MSVDEGSRVKRMVVGFGAGASEIRTLVQVYETVDEGRRLVEDFYTTVKGSAQARYGTHGRCRRSRWARCLDRGGERRSGCTECAIPDRRSRCQGGGGGNREGTREILCRAGLDRSTISDIARLLSVPVG